MKRLIIFLTIFITLTMGLIAFFGVKTNAYVNTDYKHIDDINYIGVKHNIDDINNIWFDSSYGYFPLSFNETSDIYGLPSTFETVSQIGLFKIYFNSNLPLVHFLNVNVTLTISNDGGFSFEYIGLNVMAYQVGSVYALSADFENASFQQLNVVSNSWTFDFKIYGDFYTGDYISVLSNYGVDNNSYFEWFYYKDFNTDIDDYWRGYGDGLNDGYYDGYDYGYDDGYGDAYDLGYDYGYDDGYNQAFDDNENFNFTSLLAQIFMGLGSLLAIELLPGISIGAIIAVPIVFGIIAFIIGKRGGKDD